MRVLLIANTLPPHDLSGAGEQVMQLATGLRALGHVVHVLGRGKAQVRGPKVLFPVAAVGPALRAVRRLKPDVVQLHESDGGLVAAALRLFARWLPPTLVVALQQVSYLEELRAVRPLVDRGRNAVVARPVFAEHRFRWLRAPAQLALGRLTAKLSDLVFAPSRKTADEVERDYRVAGVKVLPNVTGGLARPGQAPLVSAPQALAAERNGPFLFVGRFRIRKGIELLLEALAKAHPTDTGAAVHADDSPAGQVRLILVGTGERQAAVEKVIHRLGLDRRVERLGRRTAGEIDGLIRACRALVVPSTYEGMPLVILEAMTLGCPVIATRVSGIPEVVEDGVSGWLVESERVEDLTHALEDAWARPGECGRRGELARAAVASYRPELVAELWLREVATAMRRLGRPMAETS